MQSNCMLCLLVLFVGSVMGMPIDDIPKSLQADGNHPADPAPKDPGLALAPADPGIAAPASADKGLAVPASDDPDIAIKAAVDSLNQVKDSLKDAVSAIIAPPADAAGQRKAEGASVTVPALAIKPLEITANKKYSEIVGQFIADLIQIPIVLLHAFGEAIAGLTGSRPPIIVYPSTPTPVLIQTPAVTTKKI